MSERATSGTAGARRVEGDDLADSLLVLRAQTGSRAALAELIRRHDARLRFYLRRLLGAAPGDADDLRQETWLTVVRKLHTLEDPGAFKAWLYTVARRHGLSWFRRRLREVPLDEAALEPPSTEERDEALPAAEVAAIYAAVERLPAGQREILSLRFLSELSYQELAQVLGCPVGTVRSRLHSAKQALRKALSTPSHGGSRA